MANQKVLIVDDSKAMRMQVREMLPKGSFEVLEAADGMEGLEVINREALSLILIDFFMPRMNGWEVVQKLSDHPRFKNIPVVMMSGRREDVEQAVPEQFSYFEFVGKPFEQPLLVQAIKAAMAKARVRQQAQTMSQPISQPGAVGQTVTQLAQPTRPAADKPVAVSAVPAVISNAPVSANASADLQTLQSEMRSLRQENTQLRTEVDSLKKQVAQIMTFIRQRMK